MKNEKLTDKQFLWEVFRETSKHDKLCRVLPYLHGHLEQTEEGRKVLAEAYEISRKENQENA